MLARTRLQMSAALLVTAFLLMYGSQAIAADTKTVKAGDLQLTVPDSWKSQPVRSQFRKAQMTVPSEAGDKGESDFVVYYFEGGGGGIDANVQRWVRSFQPNGRKVKVTEGKSRLGSYVLVDCQGTWNKPIGPMIQQKTEEMANSRALSVILTTKEGNYYIRLTGPEKTVAANINAFRATFGADASGEKERAVAQ